MMSTQSPPIYELTADFYDEVAPATFPKAILRYRNQEAAELLGLDHLSPKQWQEHFCNFSPLPNNIKTPLALRYHGHQFRTYNPHLGDGRGFLFAQFLVNNKLYDLGTKGSGMTPYSRGGDGRLTLKGAFREILATELLQSLGVNTSKTFSVFETGESLHRQDEPSPTRSAVLVRMSHSHIRFGSFQRLAFLQQAENIRVLLNYCVRHYFPDLQSYTDTELAHQFLTRVTSLTADTVAAWMIAGFVHGVLNTDNMNITGESFDYGPYRFLPTYDPNFTAAYFDHSGLYCFGRQPPSVLWNLLQLGRALKVGYVDLPVEEHLENFSDEFSYCLQRRLLHRLNLRNPFAESQSSQGDTQPQPAQALNEELLRHLFQFMTESKALYEQTFYDLHSGADEIHLQKSLQISVQAGVYQHPSFAALRDTLECFEVDNPERAQHNYFTSGKACSLLIDELEAIWSDIAAKDDWTAFKEKLREIRSFRGVYDFNPDNR